MKYHVPTDWVAKIKDPEAKQNFVNGLVSNIYLQQLRTLIEAKVKAKVQTASRRVEDYETPCWSHKQAHRNGYQEAMTDLLDLLTFRPEE